MNPYSCLSSQDYLVLLDKVRKLAVRPRTAQGARPTHKQLQGQKTLGPLIQE